MSITNVIFRVTGVFHENVSIISNLSQGRIQDLGLGGGAWVEEGIGDRLRSPAGPGQSPSRGSREAKPPLSSGGLRNYRHSFERQF